VVVCGFFFVLSLLFGTARGLIVRLAEEMRTRRRVGRQHLLRAMHEAGERWGFEKGLAFERLLGMGTWSRARLRVLLAAARKEGLIETDPEGTIRLSPAGRARSERLVRNHRLWEIYLIEHADIAPSHVDRDADEIEHVLGREMAAELEGLLASKYADRAVPPSPHLTPVSAAPNGLSAERGAP
jgi:manganese/zinc/iron transport system permease protein